MCGCRVQRFLAAGTVSLLDPDGRSAHRSHCSARSLILLFAAVVVLSCPCCCAAVVSATKCRAIEDEMRCVERDCESRMVPNWGEPLFARLLHKESVESVARHSRTASLGLESRCSRPDTDRQNETLTRRLIAPQRDRVPEACGTERACKRMRFQVADQSMAVASRVGSRQKPFSKVRGEA